MGLMRCRYHGLQGTEFVSPAVHKAFHGTQHGAAPEIRRVRFVFLDDEYPPGSMWLDPEFAGRQQLTEHVLLRFFDADEAWSSQLLPACVRCLYPWLRGQGIDTAYSPDEAEFLRICGAIERELDASLREFFLPALRTPPTSRVRSAALPEWRSYSYARGRPLVALVAGPAGALRATCTQRGGELHCTSEAAPAGAATTEGPSVTLPAALDEFARGALRSWARDVLAFFAPHAAALGLLEG